MEAAVHIDIVSGGVTDPVTAEYRDRFCHVLRHAPAGDRKYPFFDQAVILFLHHAGHIRQDDARADFIDRDPLRCQTVRIEGGQHGNARLGHAVLSPAGAGYHGGTARNIDDGALVVRPFAFLVKVILGDHLPGCCLGHEHVSLCIRAGDVVIAFFRHFQEVRSYFRSHAGIVYKNVDPSKTLDSFPYDPRTGGNIRRVGLHI